MLLLLSACIAFLLAVSAYVLFVQENKEAASCLPNIEITFRPAKDSGSVGLKAQINFSSPCQLDLVEEQDRSSNLLFPPMQRINARLAPGSVTVSLSPELVHSVKSGKSQVILMASKPNTSIIANSDLQAQDSLGVSRLSDPSKVSDRLKELTASGDALSLKLNLPDEQIAFLPVPPPAPRPVPIQRSPVAVTRAPVRSTKSSSSEVRSNAPFSVVDRQTAAQKTQSKHTVMRQQMTTTGSAPTNDQDDDDADSPQPNLGSNQLLSPQHFSGQRIIKQKL